MGNRGGGARWPAGLREVLALSCLGLGVVLGAGGAPAEGPPFEVVSDWSYYNRTGWLALERGRLDRAEQAFRMAIQRMRPYEATDSVILARSYADLAQVLHQRGRYDDAEPLARWALKVRETAPGKKSEALSQNLELLAKIQVARRRDVEAEPVLKRLLALREKNLGLSHVDLIPAVEALAALYARQGRIAEAEPVYRRAFLLREANHAENLRQAEEQEKKADLLRMLMVADGGTPAGARSMVGRATQVQRLESRAQSLREVSSESISAAVTTEGYSAMLRRAGRVDEAEEFMARSKAIRDAVETRVARLRAAADR